MSRTGPNKIGNELQTENLYSTYSGSGLTTSNSLASRLPSIIIWFFFFTNFLVPHVRLLSRLCQLSVDDSSDLVVHDFQCFRDRHDDDWQMSTCGFVIHFCYAARQILVFVNCALRIRFAFGSVHVFFCTFRSVRLTAVRPSHRIGNLKNSQPYTFDYYCCYRVCSVYWVHILVPSAPMTIEGYCQKN